MAVVDEFKYQVKSEPSLNKNTTDYIMSKNKTIFFVALAVCFIVISFILFLKGVYNTKNAFSYQVNNREQITFCDSDYPECSRILVSPSNKTELGFV